MIALSWQSAGARRPIAPAKRLFGFSILYLFALFAVLLAEWGLGGLLAPGPFSMRHAMAEKSNDPGVVLTDEQKRQRRNRSIAMALVLGALGAADSTW